jgi:hypothetical protein
MLTPATFWALLTGLHSPPWEDLDAEDADDPMMVSRGAHFCFMIFTT